MKKIMLGALFLSLISSLAQARPMPDEVGVCYQFKDDKLIDMGVCVISAGYGAGGTYTHMKFQGKSYTYERSNDKEYDDYVRDVFYGKVTDIAILDSMEEEEMIYCFKDKPYDICHN